MYFFRVALLTEGVDRNGHSLLLVQLGVQSPSSRRAWIEIVDGEVYQKSLDVALLTEGVDRN